MEGSQEGVESMDSKDANINEHLSDINTGAGGRGVTGTKGWRKKTQL